MRYMMVAALALVTSSAMAQESASDWGFFSDAEETNGLLEAYVGPPDGTQLVLKCYETGRRQTFAIFVTTENLVAPDQREKAREITIRFDGGAKRKSQWRYFYETARIVHERSNRNWTDFFNDLSKADTVSVQFDALNGLTDEVTINTKGSADAIARVFESCKDKNPAG